MKNQHLEKPLLLNLIGCALIYASALCIPAAALAKSAGQLYAAKGQGNTFQNPGPQNAGII